MEILSDRIHLLARVSLQQSDPVAAEGELRRALQSKPTAEMHFELGLTVGLLGKLDSAAAEFHRALLRRQGNHAGALAQFREAVEIDPKDPEAQYNLGVELKSGGDAASAIAAFRRAAMSDRDLAEAHYNLGLAAAQSAHLDEAVHELNEAISLEPKYTDARIQLGLILSKKDDTASVANVFREIVRRERSFAKAPYNLALALHRQGEEAEAQPEFDKAYQIAPGLRNTPRP